MSISTRDDSPELEGPEPAGGGATVGDGAANGTPDGTGPSVSCTSCGAALDPAQRYCVECGIHRIGVNDPAASYMNRQPAAGARATRAVIVSSRQSRWITALVLALIPVAVGLGVLVGRSSNSDNAALLKAARSRDQIITVPGRTAVVTIGAGAKLTGSGSKATTAASKSSTTASGRRAASSTVGAKASAAQKAQSAKIVTKLQTSTGESYLDPLPSQVGGG